MGTSQLTLDGGLLSIVNTEAILGGDGFQERWFDGEFGDAQLAPIDGASGFLALAPAAVGNLDTALNFDGDQMSQRSGGMVGTDNLGAVWYGQINIGGTAPLAAGEDILLATQSDDGSTLWVDLNDNGTFEPEELIVDNRGEHDAQAIVGVVNLPEGSYDRAIGYYETTGAEVIGARYYQGPTFNLDPTNPNDFENLYNIMMLPIDPSDDGQQGLWTAYESTPFDATDHPLTVLSDSQVRVTTGSEASFGALELGGVLTTAGAFGGMTFDGTTIAADTTVAGFDTQVDTRPGLLDGKGRAVTIIKTGPAALILDQANTDLQSATFDVQEGALIPLAGTASFGGGNVHLSGGELLLTSIGGDVTIDQAVSVEDGGTITAGTFGESGPFTATGTTSCIHSAVPKEARRSISTAYSQSVAPRQTPTSIGSPT